MGAGESERIFLLPKFFFSIFPSPRFLSTTHAGPEESVAAPFCVCMFYVVASSVSTVFGVFVWSPSVRIVCASLVWPATGPLCLPYAQHSTTSFTARVVLTVRAFFFQLVGGRPKRKEWFHSFSLSPSSPCTLQRPEREKRPFYPVYKTKCLGIIF